MWHPGEKQEVQSSCGKFQGERETIWTTWAQTKKEYDEVVWTRLILLRID